MPYPTFKTVFSLRRLQDENDETVIEVINRLVDEAAVPELHVVVEETE